MIWVALTTSVISMATALVAVWRARVAHVWAAESQRRADAAEERTALLDARMARQVDEVVAGEPTRWQLISAALDDGDGLSNACHVVIRALNDGGEPPTSRQYAQVQRCSDLLTASVGRMRAPHYGDTVRDVTDELVTLHHSLLAEVRQHREARYPFVGAKDTTLASLVLGRFDAELARLRLYQQTGRVPEPELTPLDFDTIRFVPRETPAQRPPPAPDSP